MPGASVVAVALLAVGVATWIYRARFARFDTDEAQHLHVVWGWAHGMLPYRDFFDNHVPLFHVLCVPFYLLMGDRADLLIWARMAMLPIFLLCLLCAWMTARAVFGQRTALWTAVGVCLWPQFLDCTAQFRTDDLWRVVSGDGRDGRDRAADGPSLAGDGHLAWRLPSPPRSSR